MDKKSNLYLAGAAVTVVLIVALIAGGGLNEKTRALLDAELAAFDQNVQGAAQLERSTREYLKKDPSLFTDVKADWESKLAQAQTHFNAAKASLSQASEAASQDNDDLKDKIDAAIQSAKAFSTEGLAVVTTVASRARDRAMFKQNRAQRVADTERRYLEIATVDLADIKAQVARASIDWPAKKPQLDGYLALVADVPQTASTLWQQVQQETAKPNDQIHWAPLIGSVEKLDALYDRFKRDVKVVPSLCKQLYTSWDKILEDMEIEEGTEVAFYHTYRMVTVTIVDMATRESTSTNTSQREKITRDVYEKTKGYLGMALASKPAGKFDSEATSVAQPPGYAYMCPPSQNGNQYGSWQRGSGGSSFWVWYGQYAFLSSLLWGARGTTIFGRHYNDYRGHAARGKTYYGRDQFGKQRYGSVGTATRQRYGAKSKYLRSGGYARSKYVRSGGTYRGSRYTRAASSHRSSPFGRSGRSRSWGRSSRFGGGK
ncbi:MAG: hypothetical protein QNJ97_07085 [Myxococcota bacterium]|nr:hypothetical protein [Myxococcota bacterium]